MGGFAVAEEGAKHSGTCPVANISPMDEVSYARNGDIHLAYKISGTGPVDFLLTPTWFSNLDLYAEFPPMANALRQMPRQARVIMWDRRGSGLSDRLCGPATLEEGMDDLLTVLDAAGSEKAALFGLNESGSLCALTAATHPERVSHLILYGSYATTIKQDDYPWAPTPEERDMQVQFLIEGWGTALAGMMNPASGMDKEFLDWAAKWQRNSVSPDAVPLFYEALTTTDVRHVLPTISVPTLILHRKQDEVVPFENGLYLAEKIPGAKLVELEGGDHIPFLGDWNTVTQEIDRFVIGDAGDSGEDRVLATLMFTDIVCSTEKAAEIGDSRWRALLDQHDLVLERQLKRFQGKLVKTTGDGSLATFDGPARAVRCAAALQRSVNSLGLQLRIGIHTGEVELRGADISGIAVHIAARVATVAEPGEILVSASVPPLIAGSGLEFVDRGEHELKGVPGRWKIHALTSS